MKKVPNILSSLRIAGALFLLFVAPFSVEFYIIYALCGLTDILDGYIARQLNCESETGARLDSVADFVFLLAVFSKVLSEKYIVGWMFIWFTVIAIIKTATVIFGFVKYHTLALLHTNMNKASGVSRFYSQCLFMFSELKLQPQCAAQFAR